MSMINPMTTNLDLLVSIIVPKNWMSKTTRDIIMESKNDELRCHHFSHEHSLDYTKLHPQGEYATCAGCGQTISPGKFYYKCKLCGFYLHQVCFNMPENVTHPSDPNHNLTLETFPIPSKLPTKCKSCERPIKGFYYRCCKCINYYHTLCLAAPLSMKTPLHRHSLNIEFVPVYDFQCDLCDKPSYSGWVYHCNLCEFDAHLSCVLINKGMVQPSPIHAPLPVHAHAKGNQQQDELIELLTKSSNLPQNNQDQSMQSFQLSEACFSIDFQNSLIGSNGEKMHTPDHQGVILGITELDTKMYATTMDDAAVFEEPRRSEKSRGSSYSQKSTSMSSGGIGAHIWTELEEATEKRNSKPVDTRVEPGTGSSGSSLPKFMCCFNIG